MQRRLTRACYEARAWLAGVGESRGDEDAIGKMAFSLRNLSGQELIQARNALEELLVDNNNSEIDNDFEDGDFDNDDFEADEEFEES